MFRFARIALLASAAAFPAQAAEQVDVALVLAVDVSGSVDTTRYTLQMEGIAAAFESRDVEAGILSGPHRSMLVAMVQWSDRPSLSLPWTLLANSEDVHDFAAKVRRLRRAAGNFTCMSKALRNIADKVLTQLPVPADRLVVDVSGDGHDNCNPPEPMSQVRDELAGIGVTINGLPILEGDEAGSVETWYRSSVIGGPGAFLITAAGYGDFERAMRRKFVTEISAAPCRSCVRAAGR